MAKKVVVVEDDQDPNEDPVVVAKVDEMMDPAKPAEKASEAKEEETPVEDTETVSEEEASGPPPLDIFADAPSAPELIKTTGKKADKKEVKTERDEPEPAEESEKAPTKESEPEPEETKETEVKESKQDSELDEAIVSDNLTDESIPIEPDDFDDPKTAKAIDDIVSLESDVVLDHEDQSKNKLATKTQKKSEKKPSHKLFWSLVIIVCLIAVVMALFILDPAVHLPKNISWNSIKHHI
jgi:hypothetical protein